MADHHYIVDNHRRVVADHHFIVDNHNSNKNIELKEDKIRIMKGKMINKRKDFVPRSYASRIFFLRQFLRVFLTEAANYGFSQEEIDEITLLINQHIENHRNKLSKRDEAQAATAKALVSGKLAIDKVRKFSSRIKVAPNYHDSFGRLLGIIGEETVLDPDEMKPTLKVSLSGGVPVIKWKKHFTDGIDIFSRRGAETVFISWHALVSLLIETTDLTLNITNRNTANTKHFIS